MYNFKQQLMFINNKPAYGCEFKIDKDRAINEYLEDFPSKKKNLKLKVYNDTSVKVYEDAKLKGTIYLNNLGIANVRVHLAGRDIEHEQALKASEQFSREMREAKIGAK